MIASSYTHVFTIKVQAAYYTTGIEKKKRSASSTCFLRTWDSLVYILLRATRNGDEYMNMIVTALRNDHVHFLGNFPFSDLAGFATYVFTLGVFSSPERYATQLRTLINQWLRGRVCALREFLSVGTSRCRSLDHKLLVAPQCIVKGVNMILLSPITYH